MTADFAAEVAALPSYDELKGAKHGPGFTRMDALVLYLMLRRPEDLAVEENHVSWAHMYRMMFVAQIGFALAYLL